MARSSVRVDHPVYRRLLELDKEAARRFPLPPYRDPGFGSLGLIFSRKLDEGRYPHCTPLNCRPFASTGGNGVHFSFLVQDRVISEHSPVVVTIPTMGGGTFVVGESLFDFLCLGYYRGYFALEQLGSHRELTLDVFTNPNWQPTESWHGLVGYLTDEVKESLLAFLRAELGLCPWADPEHFTRLQERYESQVQFPEDE